jgi:threonine dehydrogenase-like Zn-dependent dehydrogenase
MRSKILCALWGAAQLVLGDVVQCENGDRYTGKVLLVNETEIRLINDIHGALTIPRARVLSIQFQRPGQTNAPAAANAPAGEIKLDPAAIEQVQREFLGTANPEANQMFQEMVRGLASGTLNLGDIRAKAESTLEEVRQLQKELGDDDTAGLLNSYVGILENFVKQAGTNTPPPKPTPPSPPPTDAR